MINQRKIVVWDTEYTSWKGCNENGWNNEKGEYKEIIQIGAVKLDTQRNRILEDFNRVVRPKINSELSDYIKDLTGITQSQVDNAEQFEEVLKDFLEWSSNLRLYSYANDLDVVQRNLELYDINLELEESRFKDIRGFFRSKGVPVGDWNSGDIAHHFDPSKELLPQHDAYNDAKNMAEAVMLAQNQS